MSTRRIVITTVFVTIAAIAVLALGVRLLLTLAASRSASSDQTDDYEDWLRSAVRPAVIYDISPAIVQVSDCVDRKDATCLCNRILPNRSNLLVDAQHYDGRVPGQLRSTHDAVKNVLSKYQRLRETVQTTCKNSSLVDFPALDKEVIRCLDARNAAVEKLKPFQP